MIAARSISCVSNERPHGSGVGCISALSRTISNRCIDFLSPFVTPLLRVVLLPLPPWPFSQAIAEPLFPWLAVPPDPNGRIRRLIPVPGAPFHLAHPTVELLSAAACGQVQRMGGN